MQENYAPGSIFKIVTGTGLPRERAGSRTHDRSHNPGMDLRVGRRPINDTAPPGDYDFRRGFHSLQQHLFHHQRTESRHRTIFELGQQLHLGERTGLADPTGESGIFPACERVRAGWSDGDTANICIGQGEIAVTPLQMAVMTAAIANGGKVLWPRLVDRIEPQDSQLQRTDDGISQGAGARSTARLEPGPSRLSARRCWPTSRTRKAPARRRQSRDAHLRQNRHGAGDRSAKSRHRSHDVVRVVCAVREARVTSCW